MRILDVVRDPDDIARILHGARAPPRPPRPHPPGQALLFPPRPRAPCIALGPHALKAAPIQACVLFAPEHRGPSCEGARPPQYPGPLRNSRLKLLKREEFPTETS